MADKKKTDLFENLVMNFSMDLTEVQDILDSKETKTKKAGIPKRLTVLAEGFANHWDSARVNEELAACDCEKLYARSYYEAGLIYAFDHGMDYAQWKDFSAECSKLLEESSGAQNVFFKGGKITLKELKEYVFSESTENLQTELLTRWMEMGIKTADSVDDYRSFAKSNMEKFSSVRERARYYFCKYLYLYIQDRCDKYYDSCEKAEKTRLRYGNMLEKEERGRMEKFALEELAFLKPLTKLKRDADKQKNNMSLAEKKEYLENTALTPGGIFDEFNYFYFGYVSVEWLEILFELYGEFEEWPESTKVRVAHSLGLCSQKPSQEEWKKAKVKLIELEEEQRKKESLEDLSGERREEEKKKAYQRGRSGEDFFREFITGSRDLNRSMLISFLLFVKMRVNLDEDNKITLNRLNRILLNCGFSQLRPNQDFDRFVMEFLRSRDPMELLEEEVERQVVQGKNFYLYKVYRDSYCHQKELLDYLA